MSLQCHLSVHVTAMSAVSTCHCSVICHVVNILVVPYSCCLLLHQCFCLSVCLSVCLFQPYRTTMLPCSCVQRTRCYRKTDRTSSASSHRDRHRTHDTAWIFVVCACAHCVCLCVCGGYVLVVQCVTVHGLGYAGTSGGTRGSRALYMHTTVSLNEAALFQCAWGCRVRRLVLRAVSGGWRGKWPIPL